MDWIALKEGDKKVFNSIYERFHAQVYHYVLNRFENAYFAEEVVQITFIKLWNSRHALSEQYPLNVQIFRMAKTIIIDELRKKGRKKHNPTAYVTSVLEPMSCEVNDYVNYKDTRKKIEALLNALPPTRKRIFEMSRFEEMTHKEISEAMAIKPKTVENHINLALKYLRLFFSILVFCKLSWIALL